ncbi:ABC transporter permease [bacterium]|nr:ABC transporter permease [bacterium]
MNYSESLYISLTSIFAHKLRSGLTLLGVVIGVMTIIATMSVIKGLQQMMEEEMSQLSAGVFQVQRYDQQIGDGGHRRNRKYRPKIGMTEVRAIEENVPLVDVVAPEIWHWGATLKFENEATPPNVTIAGGATGFAVNNGYMIETGRNFTQVDVQYARPVCVIGAGPARKLFPYRDPIGERITIDGQSATVIGVFQEMGSMMNRNADNRVAVPITTFTNWWGSERSWNITVHTKDPTKIDEALEQTIGAVRVARGLKPGDPNNFGVWHSNQIVDSFNDMTKWIRIAAFGIASIALLVAGVGIMNIMLVSVTERTREIGVRKALGAKRIEIMGQFLVEAVILTEIGAVFGIVVGVAASVLVGKVTQLPVTVPIWTIFAGLIFCSIIGIAFGTWPAWKASRLHPIEALRYE